MLRRLSNTLIALALLGCAANADSAAAPAGAQSSQRAGGGQPATTADSTSAALIAKADAGRILGSDSAKVWLIAISDFQCPFCKQWHDESWAAIRKDYVETGKVRVAYVNLPLSIHRNAQPAAQAAMCVAAQGKFWPMQDALFRTQRDWENASDPEPFYEKLATEVGANPDEMRACVRSGVMQSLIKADVDRANTSGATSTPTFFVGGRAVIGAQPLAAFRNALDNALAEKQ